MIEKAGLKAGDKYIVSIDCDEVLSPNSTPCLKPTSGTNTVPDKITNEGLMTWTFLRIKDSPGNFCPADNYYPPSLFPGDTLGQSVIIIPCDNFGPGEYVPEAQHKVNIAYNTSMRYHSYDVRIQIQAGRIGGSYIVDNMGDNYTWYVQLFVYHTRLVHRRRHVQDRYPCLDG